MLHTSNSLHGYKLKARDGEIGSVRQFYFDDLHWTIRYLVADNGNWLSGKQVLISPYAVMSLEEEERVITVDMTRSQIEGSPSIETDKPVSRQFEERYHEYYGLPLYWGGPYAWGYNPNVVRDRQRWRTFVLGEKPWDAHLRSTQEVDGYHVHGTDGEIGHVEDFILDDESWSIGYLLVKTRNWLPGKRVLIAPQWLDRISWTESMVFIDLPMASIRASPEYTNMALHGRDYYSGLQGYYHRLGYVGNDARFAKRSG